MTRDRLLLAAVTVPGFIILVGLAFFSLQQWWTGEGTLHVLAPSGVQLAISIDGTEREVTYPGHHHSLPVSQGTHQVKLEADGISWEQTLEIQDGFDAIFLGGTAERCFAELDVKGSFYDTTRELRVLSRFRGDKPHEVGQNTYFSTKELPHLINESEVPVLIVEVPCAQLEAGAEELVRFAR